MRLPGTGRWPNHYAIGVTGHRPNRLFGYDLNHPGWLTLGRLMRGHLLERIDEHGSLACVSGMALGVDQLFLLVALKLRDEGHDIHVVAANPYRGQNLKWRSDEWWREIMERADERILIHDGPYVAGCFDDCDRWMLAGVDEMLAVWDGTKSGTANCVHAAEAAGIEVRNLYGEMRKRLSDGTSQEIETGTLRP